MANAVAMTEKALGRYAYDLCKMHGLGRPAHWMTLLAVGRAGVGGRKVTADAAFRADLMSQIGCGPSWVGGALADCVRVGLLVRDEAGSYALAQDFFGNWAGADGGPESVQRLVMVVVYGPEGRQLLSAGPVQPDSLQAASRPSSCRPVSSIGAPGGPAA